MVAVPWSCVRTSLRNWPVTLGVAG